MALSNKFIEVLISKISSQIIDAHINKIIMLNDNDFLISKSKNCKEKIFISLFPHEPFITLCNEDRQFTSLSNNFLLILKKELEDGRILNLEKTQDRIIKFIISNTSDAYKKYKRHLYVELIPNQTNMILTDEKDVIITSLRQTSFNKNVRLITKGLVYTLPIVLSSSEFSKFEQEQNVLNQTSFTALYQDLGFYSVIKTNTSKEVSLNDLYLNYLEIMEKSHRDHLYNEVTNCVSRHLKSLKKKYINLKNELRNSEKMTEYKLYGDLLLTYQNEITNKRQDFVTILDYEIPLEVNKTIIENANAYYQKYAKTKRSISYIKEQIALTEDKINYFETLTNQLNVSNDTDLKGIEFELIENGYINKKVLKKQNHKSAGMSQPYYLTIDNVKVGFGKNNYQNNYLTFTLAKPGHIFLHIKDRPGSHVIIFDNNPSKKVIELAASICLINAKLSDGEVQMSKKSNVKKINSLGKVSLSSYESIIIKHIDQEFVEKIKTLRKN